jgi:hypothetical protein
MKTITREILLSSCRWHILASSLEINNKTVNIVDLREGSLPVDVDAYLFLENNNIFDILGITAQIIKVEKAYIGELYYYFTTDRTDLLCGYDIAFIPDDDMSNYYLEDNYYTTGRILKLGPLKGPLRKITIKVDIPDDLDCRYYSVAIPINNKGLVSLGVYSDFSQTDESNYPTLVSPR